MTAQGVCTFAALVGAAESAAAEGGCCPAGFAQRRRERPQSRRRRQGVGNHLSNEEKSVKSGRSQLHEQP